VSYCALCTPLLISTAHGLAMAETPTQQQQQQQQSMASTVKLAMQRALLEHAFSWPSSAGKEGGDPKSTLRPHSESAPKCSWDHWQDDEA
jgi:hypothetical protein